MVKQSDEEGEECSKNPAECVKTMEQSTSAVGEQLSQTPPGLHYTTTSTTTKEDQVTTSSHHPPLVKTV